MVDFHETRLPTLQGIGSSGGPKFKTSITPLSSGHTNRNIDWEDAKAEYKVTTGKKNPTQIAELLTFFRARFGAAYGFRYKDWSDYTLARQEIGPGDGVLTEFQIFKDYTEAGFPYLRDLTKIVAASETVWIGGTPTVLYTLDDNTGILTPDSTVADTVTVEVACEFDVPVNFIDDLADVVVEEIDAFRWDFGLMETRDIT